MNQESSTAATQKIKSFTDLDAWKKSHELSIKVYHLTANFPTDEKFGLTNQIRRSSSSVGANLAEGFSRATMADKRHFYIMAHGSLSEMQNFLLLARDVEYLSNDDFKSCAEISVEISKLVNGLIKSLNKKVELA